MTKISSRTPSKWLRILIPASIILVWLTLGGIGGPYFGKISEVSQLDLTAFLPDSSEAAQVNEKLSNFRDQDSFPAIIIYKKSDGTIGDSERSAIVRSTDAISKNPAVAGEVSPPIISEDKKAALVAVPLNTEADFKEVFPELKKDISANLPTAGTELTYKITGPAGFSADLQKAFAGIDGLLLVVALSVVFVILLIVYRSPLLPFLVLMASIFALAVSILVVWLLANAGVVQINGQVQGILFILVIGAATDYSLLYVSRYREELHRQKSTWLATTSAVRSSIEPIMASGGTVIAGLLCLLLSELGSNRALGPVGSIGVLFAMATALTLLPALLLVFGRRVFWPLTPQYDPGSLSTYASRHRFWARIGAFVGKYPRRIWISCVLILAVAAISSTQLRADGVDQSKLILGFSEAREGQELLDKHFPGGSGTPAYAIVPDSVIDQAVALAEQDPGVASVGALATNSPSGEVPLGKAAEDIRTQIREQITASAPAQPPEAAAMTGPILPIEQIVEQAYPFKDASPKVVEGQVLLSLTLADPSDSEAAKDAIVRLRDSLHTIDDGTLVGGITAAQLDTNEASIRDRTVIIPAILVAITLILMLLLRSILAPLLLLATTVLSFAATLGIAAILFNNVLGLPGADPSVILYGFVFLVALGIDYNIFLMTRVREESARIGTKKGIIAGLVVTGGVITSAGIVLAATFSALAVIPILFLVQLAFIVAFGVLLDTVVVRSLLVPALSDDIGKAIWWPSRLWREKK